MAGSVVSGLVVRQNLMVEGCEGTELLASWRPGSRGRKPMLAGFFLLSHLFHLSLLEGSAHIQGGASPLVNPLWRCPHRHLTRGVLYWSSCLSLQSSGKQVTIKINYPPSKHSTTELHSQTSINVTEYTTQEKSSNICPFLTSLLY
jgi:hypothetical protein